MKAYIKIYSLSSLFVFSFLLFSCKKNYPDPFFDSFPKKFIFESVVNVSPTRLFTNGIEIFDNESINSFIVSHSSSDYFESTFVADTYKNDTFNFVSNSVIKYSGIYHWIYDTLFYTKSGNSLLIKTDTLFSFGNAFNCNLAICHIFSWRKDSISYYNCGICGPDYSTYVYNKEYKLSGNEMHIPILGYCYKSYGYGESGLRDNEFNEKVVQELTTDTLAIIKYNLIFVEQ